MSNVRPHIPSESAWNALIPGRREEEDAKKKLVQSFPTPAVLAVPPPIDPAKLKKGQDPYGRNPMQGLKMLSGKMVWPLDFRPTDLDVADLVLGMSRQNRFVGQTTVEVNVLWHSLNLSLIVEPNLALPALVHDMTEAYIVDLPRPLKNHPAFAFFKQVEDKLFTAMAAAMKLPFSSVPDELYKFDIDIGWAEMYLYNPTGYKLVRSIGSCISETQHRDAVKLAGRLKRMIASGKTPKPTQFAQTRTAWMKRFRELHPTYE